MRIVAIVCNVLVLGATGASVVTEGMPRQTGDLALTLAVLGVALLSAIVLAAGRAGARVPSTGLFVLAERTSVVCNVLVFAACLWVAVGRYPYPEGNSIIPFAVLLVATPIMTVIALLGAMARTPARRAERGTAGAE